MTQLSEKLKPTKIIQLLLYLFLFVICMDLLLSIYCIIQNKMNVIPDAIINTGFSYRFRFPIGYGEINFSNLSEQNIIKNDSLFIITAVIGKILTSTIPLIFTVFYSIRIAKILSGYHSPFAPEIPKYIKNIGLIFLLIGFLGKSINQLIVNKVNFDILYINNPFQLNWIICGILLFVLSDIFSKGAILQQNDDNTL